MVRYVNFNEVLPCHFNLNHAAHHRTVQFDSDFLGLNLENQICILMNHYTILIHSMIYAYYRLYVQ